MKIIKKDLKEERSQSDHIKKENKQYFEAEIDNLLGVSLNSLNKKCLFEDVSNWRTSFDTDVKYGPTSGK
jgi:hypothetical protein